MIFACQIYFLAALLSLLPIHRSSRESFDFFYDAHLPLFACIVREDAENIHTEKDIQIMYIVQIEIVGKRRRRSIDTDTNNLDIALRCCCWTYAT